MCVFKVDQNLIAKKNWDGNYDQPNPGARFQVGG